MEIWKNSFGTDEFYYYEDQSVPKEFWLGLYNIRVSNLVLSIVASDGRGSLCQFCDNIEKVNPSPITKNNI